MWNWFNCYLSGRHDYGVWCESGTVFLRCVHCGRRSSGWAIETKPHAIAAPAPSLPAGAVPRTAPTTAVSAARVVPFPRVAVR